MRRDCHVGITAHGLDRGGALGNLRGEVSRITVAYLVEVGYQRLGEVAHLAFGHHRERKTGAAVVRMVGVVDLGTPGAAARQLDRQVDRLGTRDHRVRRRRGVLLAEDQRHSEVGENVATSACDVVREMVEQCLDAMERMNAVLSAEFLSRMEKWWEPGAPEFIPGRPPSSNPPSTFAAKLG